MSIVDNRDRKRGYVVVIKDRRNDEIITRTIRKVKGPDDALHEMRKQMITEFNIPEDEYDAHYRVSRCTVDPEDL